MTLQYYFSVMLCEASSCGADCICFFFQAEDGIRDLVRSRGLGDVYKRQELETRDERIASLRRDALELDRRIADLKHGQEERLSLIHI